jgi:hypothetical protein
MHGEDLLDGRRVDLCLRLTRQLHRSLVAGRVRLDACEVEDYAERHDGLADRLSLPRLRELRDECGNVGGLDPVDWLVA